MSKLSKLTTSNVNDLTKCINAVALIIWFYLFHVRWRRNRNGSVCRHFAAEIIQAHTNACQMLECKVTVPFE